MGEDTTMSKKKKKNIENVNALYWLYKIYLFSVVAAEHDFDDASIVNHVRLISLYILET